MSSPEPSLDAETFRPLGHLRTTVADVEGTVARLGRLAADPAVV